MEIEKAFIETLAKVNRPGIPELIKYLLEESTFFTDPASARFHGNWEGGLCAHSYRVYQEFVKLTGRDDDTAKVACLLHDVCKIGTYKLGSKNVKNPDTGKWESVPQYENQSNGFPCGHGEKSVIFLFKYIPLTEEEILMIRWHMGPYESKECWRDLQEAQKKYPSVLYIHFADMISSTFYDV
ncbi:MAG: HD domain-containing protein [Acholeplasmatales bacterium]|nr:HD domain-containing protein [Acholeplasmatales bacterium]